MKDYKLHISEGFKDVFGKEMIIKNEIENRVRHSFQKFGYELIKTPTVEYIDVYSIDGIQKPDLYNLINRQGEVLSLCNDMTSSISRFVCSNNLMGPLKLCYIADVFRYPRLYQGKQHQFSQAGIEFISNDKFTSDVEAVYLAHRCLKNCGVNNFTIHIGSARFLELLFKIYGIDNNLKKKVYTAIEDKDYVTLKNTLFNNMSSDKADFIVDLMLRGGKLKYIETLISSMKNKEINEELVYLKRIYTTLMDLGVDSIIFDFSIYSYAKYYTGIIFSIYVDDASKAIIDGGRCDKLFDAYGKNLANIGFGLDVDTLAAYVLDKGLIEINNERFVSFCLDDSLTYAIKQNNEFRKDGIIVNHLSFNSKDDALVYARNNGYHKVVEYSKNTFKFWEVEKC